MKVLFVTRGFPSDKDPMAGNYEAVQAKAIAAKGHEVCAIAIHWENMLHVFKSRKIHKRINNGIHVYECNCLTASIPHVYIPKIEHWVREKQFKRIFNEYRKDFGMPDIVHAHIISMASPAIYLKKDFKLPFVITEHWSVMSSNNTSNRIMNMTFAYNCADRVICVSEALAKSLKQKCGVNSFVINNMVSDIFFENRKFEHNNNKFRFIAVGSLREIKCFDILVESFALCHFSGNVCLDIIGEGKERKKIEGKIKEYGIENQVRLHGVKMSDEVNDLLCHSDCFVLSSRLETFAIVIIEAMAKGLPVIATKCGGPETFVRPQDGLLVEKENVKELSEAMQYMLLHHREYNADEIRRHCRENFSQDVIADKIIDVYNQIITKKIIK